jgi:hypothetical protein
MELENKINDLTGRKVSNFAGCCGEAWKRQLTAVLLKPAFMRGLLLEPVQPDPGPDTYKSANHKNEAAYRHYGHTA